MPQVVVAGDRVNFGDIVRRYGCSVNMSGGNVSVTQEGYYDIDTSVTFVAGAAGVVTVTLLKDGVIIPGAVASVTVADADTVTVNTPPCTIRQKCCCESAITAVISGVAGSITNATIRVEKDQPMNKWLTDELDMLDMLTIIGFVIGLKNYKESLSQSDIENSLREVTDDIHKHLEHQDIILNRILERLEMTENDR